MTAMSGDGTPLERYTVDRRTEWGVRSPDGSIDFLDENERHARGWINTDAGEQLVRRDVYVWTGEWQDADPA